MNSSDSSLENKSTIYIQIICIACLLLTISKILSFGFTPSDDALRHAAVAYSGGDYVDALVTNPDIDVMDSTPVFHAILRNIQAVFQFEKLNIVGLLIFSLFSIVAIPPIFTSKRPEAWLITLSFFFLTGGSIQRLCLGRPYLISFVAIILILQFYDKIKENKKSRYYWAIGIITIIDVLLHGTWYLFALPMLSFLILERNYKSLKACIIILVGIFIGLLATGQPIHYLTYQFQHALLAGEVPLEAKVSEFLPYFGNPVLICSIIILFILSQSNEYKWLNKSFKSPAFILFLMTLILGILNRRFYIDIGVPALLVWITLITTQILERSQLKNLQRIVLTLITAFIFYYSQLVNIAERWEETQLNRTSKVIEEPETYAEWLPEPGGIAYNTGMVSYYTLYFTFPDAPWKYIQGLEKAIMPTEDLSVVIDIHKNKNWDSLKVWVDKMTPKDRLILDNIEDEKLWPQYSELEFINIEKGFLIGRLKR